MDAAASRLRVVVVPAAGRHLSCVPSSVSRFTKLTLPVGMISSACSRVARWTKILLVHGKLFVAVSAFGPIPDIGDVERFVRH